MPKYRVLEMSFINDRIVQAGEEIEYAGDPSDNLEPLCEEGQAAVAAYAEKEKARIAKLVDQFGPASGQSAIGNMDEFVKQLAQANAEANAAVISKQVSEGIAAAFALFFPQGLNKPPVTPVVAAPEAPAADAPLV